MTASILAALQKRHPYQHNWIALPELRMGTGYGRRSEQRVDLWAMHLWPSTGLLRVSYEIKTSRSDFLREIKDPLKRRAGLLISNQFYFATPVGLLKPEEIPVETGLLEVDEEGGCKVIVDAPFRDTNAPTWMLVGSIYRSLKVSQIP